MLRLAIALLSMVSRFAGPVAIIACRRAGYVFERKTSR
jgi:hypothetical protein